MPEPEPEREPEPESTVMLELLQSRKRVRELEAQLELQRFFCYLSVLPLVSVPVSLFVLGLPLWGVVLAALAVLFGVCHNRVSLCVRAYLPAYAVLRLESDGARCPSQLPS